MNKALQNTRPEAADRIKSHLTDAAANAKILRDTEMWGGKALKAVVPDAAGPGAIKDNAKLTEVALTEQEFAALKATDQAAADAYVNARAQHKGALSPKKIAPHPVDLRQTLVAAKEKIGPDQSAASNETAAPNLTDEEKALLTPDELNSYMSIFNSAKGYPKDPNLQAANKNYRDRIAKEGRTKPYVEPKSLEEFNAMEDWHKKLFCSKPWTAPPAPQPPVELERKALPQLEKMSNCVEADAKKCGDTYLDGDIVPLVVAGGAPASSAPSWVKAACAPGTQLPADTGSMGSTGSRQTVPNIGSPKESGGEKKPNPWLAAPLIYDGVKGAVLGLLIGSFAGPVGMIAGAAAGAAFFYGLAKFKSKDE